MDNMREDFEDALEATGTEFRETEQEVITEDVSDFEDEGEQETGEQNIEAVENNDEAKAEAAAGGREDPEQKPDNEKVADNNSMKAPVDWSPNEREQWSKIPRNLQEKITAREKDMATQMAGTADARQTHGFIEQLGQNYAPVLAAEGAQSPLHAIKSLFDTVASLRMGTPQDKATKMAELITHYGIDIGSLDDVLSGQQPEYNPNQQLEQMIDQRMAPVTQMIEQQKRQEQNQMQVHQDTATKNVKDFADGNEFLGDVRLDMADLIDMAAKQGRPLSLQQAYDRACSLNPEIASIIAEREKTKSIMGNGRSMSHKRNAASSLNGRQIGMPGRETTTMRDAIADAWNEASN